MNDKKAPSQPKWWSPSIGIWFLLGFLVLAATPYLTGTARLLAQGKGLSVQAVQKEVEMKAKEEKKKMEKDEHEKEAKKPADKEKDSEIKALLSGADGKLYAASKRGLYVLQEGSWTAMEGFPGHDPKYLALQPDGQLLVGHKEGLHRYTPDSGAWTALSEEEVGALTCTPAGDIFLVSKKSAQVMKWENNAWTPHAASLAEAP